MGACMVATICGCWFLSAYTSHVLSYWKLQRNAWIPCKFHAATDCCCQRCSECLQMQFNIEDCQPKKTSCYIENKKNIMLYRKQNRSSWSHPCTNMLLLVQPCMHIMPECMCTCARPTWGGCVYAWRYTICSTAWQISSVTESQSGNALCVYMLASCTCILSYKYIKVNLFGQSL